MCIEIRQRSLYSRMQTAIHGGSKPLHTMGAHTEALWLTADSSSSSDEDETYEASPATTAESSDSPATAAAVLMFALKGKLTKWPTNSDRCPFFTTVDGSNALLCEPLVNFNAKFYCLATDKIAFARPILSVHPCISPWQVGTLRALRKR